MNYLLIEWPDVQDYMEEQWFETEAIAGPLNAFFIPEHRIIDNNLYELHMKIETIYDQNEQKALLFGELMDLTQEKRVPSKPYLETIGYKTIDFAKPSPMMNDLLNNALFNNRELQYTVFDYTDNRFGQLSFWPVKFINKLME